MDLQSYHDVTVGNLLTRLSTDLPDSDALVYGSGPRYSFDALETDARTIARGLLAIGVEPGERVVLWATNVPEWVVLQFALAKIGAILVPVHTSLGALDSSLSLDILHIIRQSEAATIISLSGFRGLDYTATQRHRGILRPAAPRCLLRYPRSDLNPVRNSSVKISGCSQAAK